MPDSQGNHGGLAQSVHNSGSAAQASHQSSTQPFQQAANQPNHRRVNRRNNRHGKNSGKQHVNQNNPNQSAQGHSGSTNHGPSNQNSLGSSKKHGGLLQSMHSSSGAATSTNSAYSPRASQPHGHYGGLLQSVHNLAPTSQSHGLHGGFHQNIHSGANSNNITSAPPQTSQAHGQHGGLLQSVHNSSGGVTSTTTSQSPLASQAHGLYGGLQQSIHSTSAGSNHSNAISSMPQTTGTLSDHHQASAQGQLSSTTSQQTGTTGVAPKQPELPKAPRIATLGNFYTLGSSDRDDLWQAMGLKMQKYPAHESWAIPFPAPLSLNQLVLLGFNEASVYLDERYVRLVYRTHYDSNDKEIGRDLLLGPPNPSVNLYDLRFQCAMADAWWKLVRWMDQVQSGNNLNLLKFLKDELKQEFQQKKERPL
ncbi:hypothetical protein PG987_012989 [Apiospora arundinis]